MTTKEFFPEIGKIKFEGKDSKNPMAFHYYAFVEMLMENDFSDIDGLEDALVVVKKCMT